MLLPRHGRSGHSGGSHFTKEQRCATGHPVPPSPQRPGISPASSRHFARAPSADARSISNSTRNLTSNSRSLSGAAEGILPGTDPPPRRGVGSVRCAALDRRGRQGYNDTHDYSRSDVGVGATILALRVRCRSLAGARGTTSGNLVVVARQDGHTAALSLHAGHVHPCDTVEGELASALDHAAMVRLVRARIVGRHQRRGSAPLGRDVQDGTARHSPGGDRARGPGGASAVFGPRGTTSSSA